MKFSVSCAELKRGLQQVINVIPTKSTLPILSHILIETKDGKVSLVATDLEVSLTTQVTAEVSETGSITVPGRLLYDVVREFPDFPLDIETEEGTRIRVKCARGQYTFYGEEAKDFPRLPAIDIKHEVHFSTEKLRRQIEKTVFAASVDELRAALMGVLFQVRGNEFRAVSTDGHRLARIIDKSFSAAESVDDVIIPVKALNLLHRNLKEDGETKMLFGSNYVIFDLEDASISATLIEGKYPDYEKVIPLNEEKKLIVNRENLIAALRTVSVLANRITQQVRLTLDSDSITVVSQDMDRGEGKEIVEAEYNGERMDLGFNSSYLLDMLRHIDTENIVFKLDTPVSATLIFPMDQQEDEDLLMLVMPIKLRE